MRLTESILNARSKHLLVLPTEQLTDWARIAIEWIGMFEGLAVFVSASECLVTVLEV